jgi:hypothetical protein
MPRQTERAARLNGNEERFAGIALWAFKGAQIETRCGRLDAGQPHRFAAFGAVQNSDRYSAKNWIGLSGQHDAPLGPGGSATLSVTDRCQWWGGDRTNILFRFRINIAHFQKLRLFPAMTIRTVPQRMAQKKRRLLSRPSSCF